MSESMDKMPRGQWMATEGRQLYHEWLSDILSQHRGQSFNLQDTFVSAQEMDVSSNLSRLAHDLTAELIAIQKATPLDENILFESRKNIFAYTSADEFIGDGNTINGITSHTFEGLGFAASVSTGMALEAAKALGIDEENAPDYYETLADIMRNPSFHGVLEELATTGFAVLGADVQAAAKQGRLATEIKNKVDPSYPYDFIVGAQIHDGEPAFYLEPAIKKGLLDRMRTQNKNHEISADGTSHIILALLKDTSFTSGCPVRRAPAGEEKSAIALLSDYMGDKIEDVIVKKLREQQLGSRVVEQAFAQA